MIDDRVSADVNDGIDGIDTGEDVTYDSIGLKGQRSTTGG